MFLLIAHKTCVILLLAEISVWAWAKSNVVRSVCICMFCVNSSKRELGEIKACENGEN